MTATCCKCGRANDRTLDERGKFTVELRPYGPGGAPICFHCATATPEAEQQTKAAFSALLDAHDALPGITTLSVDGLGKYDAVPVDSGHAETPPKSDQNGSLSQETE